MRLISSKLVSRDQIRENAYNLNIPRYVDSSEPAESWDIYATMFGGIPEKEINALVSLGAYPSLPSESYLSRFTQNFQLHIYENRISRRITVPIVKRRTITVP